MKALSLAVALLAFAAAASGARAAEIHVLSAGAVEPGLVAAADLFRKNTGILVDIRFATAPALRQRIGAGEQADIVIAPPAVIEDLAKAGRLDAGRAVPVGRVGVGVAVREGAAAPDVSTADALRQTVLGAPSLVYNQASTGLYLDGLFERWGIADQVKAHATRYPNGEAVMEHLIKGTGHEIGFGAITEIMLYRDKGVRFVAPLPADVQNYTSYTAAPFTQASRHGNAGAGNESQGNPSQGGASRAEASKFLDFLAREAKPVLVSKGVE